jgi:hypothetical protein
MSAHKRSGAIPAATVHAPPLLSERESTRRSRLVVPQLSELASEIPYAQLQTVRGEVQAGERVAIYRKGRAVRVMITGPDRRWYTLPPRTIEGWRRIGVVEITDDGERALPEVLS